MKIVSLELTNYKTFKDLLVEESELKDFLIFAGRNGSGKTSLLEAISFALEPAQIGGGDTSQQVMHPYVGSHGQEAKIKIRFRLSEREAKFVGDKISELVATNQVYAPGSYELDEITREFESVVRFYPDQASSSRIDLTKNYLSLMPDGTVGKLHPLSYLASRKDCKTAIYLNAFRHSDVDEMQLFAQTPVTQVTALDIPIHNDSGQSWQQKRQVMTFQPTAALSQMIMYEAFNHLAAPEQMAAVTMKLAPELERINELLAPKKILPPSFIPDQNKIDFTIETPDGKHSPKALSAGENELFILATYIIRFSKFGVLNGITPIVLIDEPELHLHPVFVERLARFLKQQDFSESHCFISSHSPDFINEFDNDLRKIEDNTVKKIQGLEQRKQLLGEIGRKITPSALVKNIVFTEGDSAVTDKMADESIYQAILDKEIINTLFVSVGSSSRPIVARQVTDKFIKAIETSSSDSNLFMIKDGDHHLIDPLSNGAPNILILNLYHVENLLLNPLAISKAMKALYGVEKTDQEVIAMIKAFLPELIEKTLETLRTQLTHGAQAKIFASLYSDIRPIVAKPTKMQELDEALEGVEEKIDSFRVDLTASLTTDEWRRFFHGRDILKRLNGDLNTQYRTQIKFVDLQRRIAQNTTFADLLPSTQNILQRFRHQ